MIAENFVVNGKKSLEELKTVMQNDMPSSSFREEPIYNPRKGTYEVSIRYNLEDAIKLEKLHKNWRQREEEVTARHKNKRETSSFFSSFKFGFNN